MRPLSGYDLKKLFDLSAAFFWPANQAQIYRTLKALVQDGLAELQDYSKGVTVDRKVYAITEKGQAALNDWLKASNHSDFFNRSPYVMHLFFSGLRSGEEQLKLLDEQQQINQVLLQQLEGNYQKSIEKFAHTAQLGADDIRLTSAVWAYKWGILLSKAYDELLEEMKMEIREKR